MKKLLLSFFCLLTMGLTTHATEQVVAFVAEGASYSGSATKNAKIENNASGNIAGETFTIDDAVSVALDNKNSNKSNVKDGQVRWYQSDILKFTPAEGLAITKVAIKAVSGYCNDVTPNVGTATKENLTITWTGNTTTKLTLTATAQIRFTYIEVTLNEAGSEVTPGEGEGGDEPQDPEDPQDPEEPTTAGVTVKDGVYTFHFTNDAWGIPNDYKTDAASYTWETYTISFGASNNGHKYDATNKYLIFGKKDATLSLPPFDFKVAKIEVVGRAGASTKVTQNIFEGDKAVSTQTTGATGTNVYVIPGDKQKKNTVYTLKVTNANNTQVTSIVVYPNDEAGISNIAAEQGAVRYYNLQGVEVENPTNGLFIRVEGNKATKIAK